MHDRGLEMATAEIVRSGLRASVASICWTVVVSTATVVLGVRAGSLVLVAFGAVGLFDAVGSVALVLHFRHALRHESISARRERLAHYVVTTGLIIVGTFTTLASGFRLAERAHADEPLVGIVLSAASIGALGYLGVRKRVIAHRIPSRALLADGWLSLAGCCTAIAAVVGLLLERILNWWWIDPLAALAIAAGALAIAFVNVRHLRVTPALDV